MKSGKQMRITTVEKEGFFVIISWKYESKLAEEFSFTMSAQYLYTAYSVRGSTIKHS